MGEPALLVDPRRWGSLIGLIGGLVFIVSYSSVLGAAVATVAWVARLVLVVATLSAHYVWPVSLGELARPSPLALATYGACVAGESRPHRRPDALGLREVTRAVGLTPNAAYRHFADRAALVSAVAARAQHPGSTKRSS